MPRVRKPVTPQRNQNRGSVRNVRRVRNADVYQEPEGNDGATASPGLLLDATTNEGGTGQAGTEGFTEANPNAVHQEGAGAAPVGFSPDLAAAAAELSAPPLDAAADPAAPGAPGADPVPAGPTLEQCIDDARELIEFAWSTASAMLTIPPRTKAAADDKNTRERIALASGRLLHHYGIGGADIIANPWAQLALAVSPIAIAALLDYREAKAAKEAAAPPAATPPVSAGFGSTSAPPPSELHKKA